MYMEQLKAVKSDCVDLL